jgi:N-acyl-phosphatidylethanolamine-hydrolysing phospholipase D
MAKMPFSMDWGRAKGMNHPSTNVNWEEVNAPPKDKTVVTWFGHSSFLIQHAGLNILTDPVFSERVSPVSFAGPKRYMPLPEGNLKKLVEKLPRIDAVVVSHNHYDHLDADTVAALGDVPHWFVPLATAQLVLDLGASHVTEMDWWQFSNLTVDTIPGLTVAVTCLPCQHFTNRGLFDRGDMLWASWALTFTQDNKQPIKIYFGGDTGYRSVPHGFEGDESTLPGCPAFKEIGEAVGPFDFSLIPIGAYSPRWFMSPIHVNPSDAVDLHLDIRSRQSVGMHWGTFILTDERTDEPPRLLKEELAKRSLPPQSFGVMAHGETRVLTL